MTAYVPDPQPPTFDTSELIEMHDPVMEAEEADTPLVSMRRKTVKPPAASGPQPPSVEEESPSTIVAKVLGDLAPREEVTKSHSGADGEAGDTQSFAFAARGEESPVEAPIEQVNEATHAEVEPVDETPAEVTEEAVL